MKQLKTVDVVFRKVLISSFIALAIYIVFPVGFVLPLESFAQQQGTIEDKLQEKAIKVFLDIRGRFDDHIKREIPYVNYVRDRKQAQVYIMQTRQPTGAGGNEYTIALIGQKNFTNVNDTLVYVSKRADTDEMTREGIVNVLKRGLMRYVEKTPLADFIRISYRNVTKETDVIDKWNFWVFNINVFGRKSGETSRNEHSLDGSISADRVTPELKVSLSLSADYEKSKYEFSRGTYTRIRRSQNFQGLVVISLNNHWSVGMYGKGNSSHYSNIDFSYEFAPAIEYNVFPYSVSTRREFRFLYKTAYKNNKYEDETIYFKTQERLFYQSLDATFELKERWGSLRASLEGSHYFHDFEKRRFEFFCNLNLRLFEGFSLDISGSYSAIHDQLSLRRRGASEADILTHQREIAKDYDYRMSVGFRYTFGSIFSNVVNPRFGNGRRGRRGRY